MYLAGYCNIALRYLPVLLDYPNTDLTQMFGTLPTWLLDKDVRTNYRHLNISLAVSKTLKIDHELGRTCKPYFFKVLGLLCVFCLGTRGVIVKDSHSVKYYATEFELSGTMREKICSK